MKNNNTDNDGVVVIASTLTGEELQIPPHLTNVLKKHGIDDLVYVVDKIMGFRIDYIINSHKKAMNKLDSMLAKADEMIDYNNKLTIKLNEEINNVEKTCIQFREHITREVQGNLDGMIKTFNKVYELKVAESTNNVNLIMKANNEKLNGQIDTAIEGIQTELKNTMNDQILDMFNDENQKLRNEMEELRKEVNKIKFQQFKKAA